MAATITELGARVLRRLGVVTVAAADRPAISATSTITEIAERALQSLGIIVPASARPSVGAATAAAIAARALQNLGVVVPETDRPSNTATVTVTELAARALQALDIPVPASAWPAASGTTAAAAVGLEALIRLGVVASDETPLTDDTTLATAAATNVHEALVRKGLVTWAVSAIPSGVAHDYSLLTALQLATSFGKQGDASQRPIIEQRIGWSSLVQRAQALAEARVTAIHAGIVAAGLAPYANSAIPVSVAEPYVQLLAIELAPVFGKQSDAGRIPQFEAMIRRDVLTRRAQTDAVGIVASVHARLVALGIVDWASSAIPASVAEDYAELIANDYRPLFGAPQDRTGEPIIEARIRRIAVVLRAQAIAEAKATALHEGLIAAGLVSWAANAIPRAISEEMVGLVANEVSPVLGLKFDPGLVGPYEQRVRRMALILAGPALAEQAVRGVHDDLAARGKTRWSWSDLPAAAERPYVYLAAYALAPEFGVVPNAADVAMATVDLARLIALPTSGERTVAEFF